MKRFLKWSGIGVVSALLLLAIPAGLLYYPPFQNWAANKVAAYASEQTGMDISVGKVHLKFPLRLSVDNVRAVKCAEQCDTIADVERVEADVQLLPLFKKKVEIDGLTMRNAKLNTTDFIPDAHVKGTVGSLQLKSHGIDLVKETLRLDQALLSDADLQVALSDTAAVDTTSTDTKWKIKVDDLQVKNSKVQVKLADGHTQIAAQLGSVAVKDGDFDLGNGSYAVGNVKMSGSKLKYDKDNAPPTDGLDTNHLELTGVAMDVDDILYQKDKFAANVKSLSFKEKSGLEVKNLSAPVSMKDGKLHLSNAKLETGNSVIQSDFDFDLNTFDMSNPGQLDAHIHAQIGKQDLLQLVPNLPKSLKQHLPGVPMNIDGRLKGNMEHMDFQDLHIVMPGHLDLTATGYAENLGDTKNLRADLRYDLYGQNADFLTYLLDDNTRKTIRIPHGIRAKGRLRMEGDCYDVDVNASEGGGTLSGNVKYCTPRPTYTAKLTANRFPVQHFVPNQGLHPFTGNVDVKGEGLDLMSQRTKITARADVKQFQYADYNLDHMQMVATVKNGYIDADVNSQNRNLKGNLQLRARTDSKNMDATLLCDLTSVDFHALGLTDENVNASFCSHLDINTNLQNYYRVNGSVGDITVRSDGEVYRPEDLDIDLLTTVDTTHVVMDCSDFHLLVDAAGGYKKLLNSGQYISKELQRQLKERHIDYAALKQELPQAHVQLMSGNDNFFVKLLGKYGYAVQSVDCNITSSKQNGLNGHVNADSLIVDGIQLDEVKLAFHSDNEQIHYEGQVRNNKDNPQYTFNALFNGAMYDRGTYLTTQLYDADNELGVQLGLNGTMEEGGLRFTPYGEDPILGYKKFHVRNTDYVFLGTDNRVSADVRLKADDGTGVQIYTNDDNDDVLQDITFSLNHFDLERVLSVIPYTPDVSGQMNGDFHVIQKQDELSVASAIDFHNLFYEKAPMGNLSTEFVYMPKSDGSHFVDGFLFSEGKEVAALRGTYNNEGEGYLDADMSWNNLPMSIVNGFIENQVVGLQGYANGQMTVVGTLNHPDVNGELQLDSAYLVSVPYGVQMRFTDEKLKVQNSHVVFDQYNMYGYNESPLVVDGWLDFRDLSHMKMDVRMGARNFLLINAKETSRSEAYGKAYVNMFASLQGELSKLNMRGKVDVLGSTDLTYVLKDSPLTTDNQLDELVKFVDLNDTTQHVVNRPPLTGFNMDLSIGIDEGAHVVCALNSEHSNYVDIIGGGDLRMQYNPADDLRLTGRYTLSSGEMKYSLPVIPLKTFSIQDGSYIEFTGDPMNPTLNITATERTKSSVSVEGGKTRPVDFECGVVITKTLSDMGLEFIIDAPEDITISSELATMSSEERGKLAVTMLTTGMYLADGNTNAFSMNSALSAFLQSQINTIAGSALRTLDLSFGVDNTTSATGSMQTDYSFKFAKRFWNNRLNVQVGGKLSTGADVESQNQTFFNNVVLEYRLNNAASKYVKVFYERDSYDWLEGVVGEYGAGFVWKRKLEHFSDLIRFKDNNSQPLLLQRRDSVGAIPREAGADNDSIKKERKLP